MKILLLNMMSMIKKNGKTLLLFQLIYRALGALVVIPLANLIIRFAIYVSPYQVVTNRVLVDFMLSYTTMPLLFLILLIVSLFMVFEFITLSILYHYSYHNVTIGLSDLLKLSIVKTWRKVKRYHVLLLIPSALFLLFVHLFHIGPIATTFNIPDFVLDQLQIYRNLLILAVVVFAVLFLIFIEFLFTLPMLTTNDYRIKTALKQQWRLQARGGRFKRIGEFVLINVVLNILLYGFYFLLIGFVALIVTITRGQALVLGGVLTVIYVLYTVIAALATLILIPVNVAWITAQYEHISKDEGIKLPKPTKKAYRMIKLNPRLFKPIAGAAVLIILALNFGTVIGAVREDRMPLMALNQPKVIAHRGSSLAAPENTIAAFQLAIDEYSDAVEFDVHMTSDGVPIVIHDFTLGRTTNVSGNPLVRDTSYEHIRGLDAGSWFSEDFAGEHVPTLEETVLMIENQAVIYLELKIHDSDLNQYVVDMLAEHDLTDNTVLMSFNQSALREIKRLEPELETLLLLSTFFGDIQPLLNLDYVDHYGIEANFLFRNEGYIDRIQQAGKYVHVWTVNDAPRMQRATELGVDGIITDDPVLARETIYSSQTRSLYANLLRRLFSENP